MNLINIERDLIDFIKNVDRSMNSTGEYLEKLCHSKKSHLIESKLTRPIYKFCVAKIGPSAATAVSFLSADLIMHQLLPMTANCLLRHTLRPILPESLGSDTALEQACNITWQPLITAISMFVAIPIIYTKYRRTI